MKCEGGDCDELTAHNARLQRELSLLQQQPVSALLTLVLLLQSQYVCTVYDYCCSLINLKVNGNGGDVCNRV